jgi:hypothetical protein
MKLILLILALTLSFGSKASELNFTAGGSFVYANILGQNDVPSYSGLGYYGEIEYFIPFSESSAMSFFGVGHKANLENSANDKIIEELQIGYLGAGIKIYLGNAFISGSIGGVSFHDEVSGDKNKTIESSEVGKEFGVGYRFRMSNLTSIVVSAHMLHASLNPENGTGFYSDYDLWQYRGSIGFCFTIPSTPIEF